jgi:2-dehydropantoate 2-reductase
MREAAMRIAVIGAGAIGGFVGARLALAGNEVTFLVRGANLDAIRRDGIRLVQGGVELPVPRVAATNDYGAVATPEVLILAVKAHQLDAVAPDAQRLIGPGTTVVPMQNGIPYWYFHEHGGPLAGTVVRSVDPTGSLARRLPPSHVLGCVVYPAAELVAPGLVHHVEGERFPLGELDGSSSERARRTSACFEAAGLKSPVLEDIRSEIWLKLWGNLTFNPISALTRATLVDICRFPETRKLAATMMTEAQEIATRLGIRFRVDLERRIAGAERVGAHKTSMLQDIEAGREPELEALVGSVAELGRLTGTPTPTIDAVLALTRLLARSVVRPGAPAAVPEPAPLAAVAAD